MIIEQEGILEWTFYNDMDSSKRKYLRESYEDTRKKNPSSHSGKGAPAIDFSTSHASGTLRQKSGVAQPAEIPDIERKIVGALLDSLAGRAQDDSSPNIAHAAQDIMVTIFATGSGVAIRGKDEILQAMAEPIRRRREFIQSLAMTRQNKNSPYYSEQDWIQWLSSDPLSDPDMDAAVQKWKSDFVENSMIQKKKVDELFPSRFPRVEKRSALFDQRRLGISRAQELYQCGTGHLLLKTSASGG